MTKAAELAKMGEVLTNSSKGRTNLIINGDMAVNQRGATSGITSGYFVDRFTLSGCSASAVITSNTPTEFPTAITVSATSGNPIVTQKIESKNVQHLSGKVVTASFFAKNVSNATTLYASLQYAGSADNWGSSTTISEQNLGTLSSDWVKYTASWTVPSGGLNGLQLNILCAGSSTFTMGVTGVMLQEGSVSTPFEHLSYAESLALCQRYYTLLERANGNVHALVGYVHTTSSCMYPLHKTMRTTPSITNTNFQILYAGTTTVNISSISSIIAENSIVGFKLNCSGTPLTIGEATMLSANGDSKLEFSAEL